MTESRAGANGENLHPERVTDLENERVGGWALCAEPIFQQHVSLVQSMRDRQSRYLASLPTDPQEAIKAALAIMHPSGDLYPDGFEEALHLSYALEAMVRRGDLGEADRHQDTVLYLADRVLMATGRAACQLDKISDILSNPRRVEPDKRVVEV